MRLLQALLGSLAMAALGVWIIGHASSTGGEAWMGVILVVSSALVLPAVALPLLDRRPCLVIDDAGITIPRLNLGTVPFDAVVTATLRTDRAATTLCLQLRDPEHWLRKMPGWRRALVRRYRSMGYSDIAVGLRATDTDPAQVLSAVLQRLRPRNRASQPLPSPVHAGGQEHPAAVELPVPGHFNETFAVRFSPAFSLSSKPANDLQLTGTGSVEFAGADLHIRGKRHRFFGLGTTVLRTLRRDRVGNVFRSGAVLRFDILTPGDITLSIQLWAADETAAQKMAAALPTTTTEESARVFREMSEFQARLNTVSRAAWVTTTLVIANVLVFVAAAIGGAGILTPNAAVLLAWGTNYGPLTTDGQWWRLFTSMFLHFGVLHLALNMWALYSSGRLVERLYGNTAYLIIYLVAGLSGSLASLLWNTAANSAGASGAIFGVYGAMVAFFLRKHTTIPPSVVHQQRSSALAFIGYNLIFGLSHRGIDNSAHIGGLLGGIAMGLLLVRPLDATHRATDRGPFYWRALAGSIVLVGSLMVAALHPGERRLQDLRFRRDLMTIGDRDDAVEATYARLIGERRDKHLTDEAFCDHLEAEVIPVWESLQATINLDPPSVDSALFAQWRALKGLIDNRLAGMRLLDQGLRNHDDNTLNEAAARFKIAKDNQHQLAPPKP